MPLAPGTLLGPYELGASLGAGGMGEVYRARDTRLNRSVAIKVLPQEVSKDPVRKQRFEREAKAISSLNHPHICVLHDIGSQDGVDYLVMECVEGETLAKRLERGPLSPKQVLKYGAQIADALDRAHRAGIVHRDLKPGNIMLTSTGAKLLDFGLAKPSAPLANAATQTTPVTQEGTIVGTFQYMSPEQIEGKDVDGRSDIFSLGAVLYEMLTGKRAFEGKSLLSVASAILEKEPIPISSAKPMTPPILDHAISQCLAKDPENRWQTARDLALELKWIADSAAQVSASPPIVSRRRLRERITLAAAILFAASTIGLLIGLILHGPKSPQPTRIIAELGADAKLDTEWAPAAVFSPDGTKLVFSGIDGNNQRRIYVRSIDQLQAVSLSSTEGAQDPFFSPDSQWIGFFADGKLKKISVQGGAAVSLCDVATPRGAAWSNDGIVFVSGIRSGLVTVSAAGGLPQPLTTLDRASGEVTQRWPHMLPGGSTVLFTSSTQGGDYDEADIVAYSLVTNRRKTILHGGYDARYLASGHLVYGHDGTLFAAPFNVKRLEITGQAVPVLEGVRMNPGTGVVHYSFSDTGNLAYVAGAGTHEAVSAYWLDTAGKFEPTPETPAGYTSMTLSPDGKRLAMEIGDSRRSDIRVYDLNRDSVTRLTFNESSFSPAWTPDSQRITYSSSEKGVPSICWKRANGAGEAQCFATSDKRQYPGSWRPDGTVLAFTQSSPETLSDIYTLTADGSEKNGWKFGTAKPFLNSPFAEFDPAFSPDGHWLAYVSNESGHSEVYVRPFPGPGGEWQVSSGEGHFPTWSRNRKELLFGTADNKIMVVNYTASGDSFSADKPQLWSPGQFTSRLGNRNFDLHPDGKRAVVLKAPNAESQLAPNRINLILNFAEELRRKVPLE